MLPLISGILLALTLPPFNLTGLAFVALVPFFIYLERSEKGLRKYSSIALGGFLYTAWSLFPLMSVQVWWWMDTASSLYEYRLLFMAAFLATVAFLTGSVFFMLYGVVYENLIKKYIKSATLAFVAMVLLWVALELFRRWALGGLMWQEIGISLWNQEWASDLLKALGLNGVGTLVVGINSVIFLLFKAFISRNDRVLVEASVIGVLVFIFCLLGVSVIWRDNEASQSKVTLYPVRSPFTTEDSIGLESYRYYQSEIDTAIKKKSDIVILPENALPYLVYDEDKKVIKGYENLQVLFETFLTKTKDHPNLSLFMGMHTTSGDKRYNSSVLVEDGQVKAVYHKRALLPLSELTPAIGPLTPVEFLTTGEGGSSIVDTIHGKVQPLLCSEVFYRNTYQQERGQAPLVVVSGNDSVFGNALVAERVKQVAQVRAIEQQVTIANATKGQSSWIVVH